VAGVAGNERLRMTQLPEKNEEAKRNFVQAAALDRREFFCLKKSPPRRGGIYALTENVASPFHAEPRQL
jgi:hypothetical protein